MQRIAGAVAGLGSLVWALVQAGMVNLDLLHSAIIPLAFTIAPEVAWLNEQTLQETALFVTAVFVALTLFKVADNVFSRVR